MAISFPEDRRDIKSNLLLRGDCRRIEWRCREVVEVNRFPREDGREGVKECVAAIDGRTCAYYIDYCKVSRDCSCREMSSTE
jgi:hypothetical protein